MFGTGAAAAAARIGTRTNPPRWLLAALGLVVLTVAVLQTAVVPVLGVIAAQLDVSAAAVSWVITANLLAATAATPLLGRLADLYHQRRVLLAVLVVVLIGSMLAAVTSSWALLIVARVLQGLSFALFPISVSILRDVLAPDRLGRAMAILSGTLGFGGGAGLVVTGLLMQGEVGYHRVFWLCAAFTGLVIVAVLLVVPAGRRAAAGTIDWLGAVGLATGLSVALVAVTQGAGWGWTSPWTLTAAGLGPALLVGWWRWERRAAQPLVPIQMLTRRRMLLTNLATVFVGMGLYFAFLGITQFVQTPREQAGYGFSASVLEASVVFLLPGALTGFVVALISGRFIDRYGARPVLAVAAVVGIAGFTFLAIAHSQPWQVIVASVLIHAYISLGYGALPTLVIGEARPGETAVATGMNAIARTIGSSAAAALVAVALSGSVLPDERGFLAIFLAGVVTAVLALLLVTLSRAPTRPVESIEARYQSRAMNHEWG